MSKCIVAAVDVAAVERATEAKPAREVCDDLQPVLRMRITMRCTLCCTSRFIGYAIYALATQNSETCILDQRLAFVAFDGD